ncbi:MAG: M57 family metalloprotease [Myxococcales bacterium]
MTQRILTAAMVLAMAGLMGCGEGLVAEEESASVGHGGLTWEEFNSRIYQEPGTDVYIVDGDTPIVGEKNLREFYDNHVAHGDQLTVNTVNGSDDKWNATQKLNITYCINKSAFGTRYSQVVQAMAEATGAWMNVANVKFVYVSAQDANCTSSNGNVVFDVNPVNAGGQYIARAFFPAQSRSTRNVLIDNSAFTSSGDPSLTGVLRHELGHTLGFRHEHTRPESGTCFEDSNYRVLTTYDQASVMHYPQCNGISSWALELTAKDAAGAAALYGAPSTGSTPTDPTTTDPTPAATTTEKVNNVSVAKSGSKYYGPYNVTAGTVLDVTMTGTGDADLYVNFGAKPTTTTYACRPYLDGTAESCSLTVPTGATTAYIMVKGYVASTFSLVITYTKAGGTTPTTPPASTGTVKSTSTDGSVAKGKTVSYNPIAVLAGTTFTVAMTGTGDADLYVRFGAAPTTSTYACRPYLDGTAETCTVTVPAGQSQAYIMVSGYVASTFHLQIDYTAP